MRRADPPSKEAYRLCIGLRIWKSGQGPKGCRAIKKGRFVGLSLILLPTVSRPVYLGIKHPSANYGKIFITVKKLQICWCGVLSRKRGWVCRLQFLLVIASAVIFRSESRGTHDHILPSQIRDSPARRFLRLAGIRWRYSTPPPLSLSESESFDTTDGQSASLSWNKALLVYSQCCSSEQQGYSYSSPTTHLLVETVPFKVYGEERQLPYKNRCSFIFHTKISSWVKRVVHAQKYENYTWTCITLSWKNKGAMFFLLPTLEVEEVVYVVPTQHSWLPASYGSSLPHSVAPPVLLFFCLVSFV
jgi:hypothetical protein